MRDTNEIGEVPKEQEETSEAARDDSEIEPIVKKTKLLTLRQQFSNMD